MAGTLNTPYKPAPQHDDGSDGNAYERLLGIPKPKCCSTGACCKGVSPSTPANQLLKLAAEGDDFARGFFSIMQPYGDDRGSVNTTSNHQAASLAAPGIVERTLNAAQTSPHFNGDTDAVVFYHCRYLTDDNRCGVHEDRPQFCRDYPDTPFIVMAPNCAYVPWAKACKTAYQQLKDSTEEARAELTSLKRPALQTGLTNDDATPEHTIHHLMEENWQLLLSLTSIYISSPYCGFQHSHHHWQKT